MAYNYKLTVFYLSLFFLLTLGIELVYSDTISLSREISRKEKQFKELKSAIERRREELKGLESKELSLMDEIYRLDKRLKEKEEVLEKIKKERDAIEESIKFLEKGINQLYIRLDTIEGALKRRLVAAYKMRHGGIIKVLLSSQDVSTIRRKYKSIGALIAYDLSLISSYTKNSLKLTEEKMMLEEKRKTLTSLMVREEAQKRAILKDRAMKHLLIGRIKKNKELNLVALKGLEEASLRLESKIEELRNKLRHVQSLSGDGFVALKGSLRMPVEGEIVSFYGKVEDPRFKTIIFNKGIEIEAREGSEVRSIYKGRVIYSDWFKGYGKMVIIDNGGGYYTIFAHLSKVFKKVGDIVEQEEVIALVGDTGSLNGPRLYFEIRHKGVPKDPLEWFVMR